MKSYQSVHLRFYITVLAIILCFPACLKKNEFPDQPVITSISFDEIKKDLLIEFTDGDGDVGIPNGSLQPPFNGFLDADSTIPNPYYYNLWIDYFEKIEGEWVLIEQANTNNFRIPFLTPEGQNKQLDVKLQYNFSTELPFAGAQSDTIKFRVTIVDRALNESIPEETEPVYSPR